MDREVEEMAFLDQEFSKNLETAKKLMRDIQLTEDIEICKKYILKCVRMQAPDLRVKRNRNKFFKYFLKMLNKSITYGYCDMAFDDRINQTSDPTAIWNKDKTSYVATQIVPGYGTLVYMAATDKPNLGWQENGFRNYPF